jgi:hypothetical protein
MLRIRPPFRPACKLTDIVAPGMLCMQTRKVLRASLMQDGNISLSVQETQSGQSGKTVQVPMTPAEWMVCVEMAKFMIPRCLGLDKNW